MRLSTSLLLPLYAGAATAIPDAKVYIFPDNGWSNAANPPALSPEETRLVFAQRLGVSQYHSLDGAADDTLSYINRFGGRQMGLFETMDDDKAAELVLFVEGASAKNAGPFLDAWSSIQPAFTISNPPSSSENLELVFQMDRQLGSTSQDCPFEEAINPGNRRCWKGKSKIIQIDLADEASGYYVCGRPGISKVMLAQDTLVRLAQAQKMNAVVVLMPESSWSTKSKNSYGIYEKLSQKQISRRELAEEPVTETSSTQATKATASSPPKYIRGVAPLCYSTLKSCQSSTNNCSGHGECYMKSNGTSITESCYACQCIAVYKNVTSGSRPYTRTTYWGGGACQKEDVSEPFWLLTILTVVLVGIIAWTIGMMYSIGEEKLPGVIGAGVSSRAG